MAQTKTSSPAAKRVPRTLAGSIQAASDESRVQALKLYESALKLVSDGKYEQAHAAFTKMQAACPPEVAHSVRMYLNACVQQMAKGKTEFLSHEEHYDYAISLLNSGNYEDAREQFQAILTDNDSADYAFYGLAVLASMTGDAHTCLEHLTEAIRLNVRNRIQARADSDFQDMADDPRFTELLYPET